VLERQLIPLDADGVPPITLGPDGQPKLNLQCKTVQSVLCSAYTGFCRMFLEARQPQNAEFFRAMGVRDLGFPQGLFDDIFKEFKVVPGPIPPRPTTPGPPGPPGPGGQTPAPQSKS